jgi:hypothetical protein
MREGYDNPFLHLVIRFIGNSSVNFWTGGSALNYLSKSKDQEVPSDGWSWLTSGRVIDLPKEAWGNAQPDRLYLEATKSYESCIALNLQYNNLHDHDCETKLAIICQKIVQGTE